MGPGAKYVLRKDCLNGIQAKWSKAGKEKQTDVESKGQKAREQGTEMEVGKQDLRQEGREAGMDK